MPRPGLSDYQFPTSANFAGTYELCFLTRIVTDRLGLNSTFNICRGDDSTPQTRSRNLFWNYEGGFFTQSFHNITLVPTDAFNAYQAKINIELTGRNHASVRNFQGFANGNNLEMQSFGVDDGDLVNHTPDDMACALHNSGVLSCTQMYQEYCGIDDPNEPCSGAEGEWLETNSLYSVSAKDISDCPQPPAGFCPDNGGGCVEFHRRLVELCERNTGDTPEKEESHRRLVTDHDEGVVTHVQSKDSDRLEWIKEHIEAQMERMEAGGTSGWDPLIEEYFKNVHSKDIEIDCNFTEDEGSFKCNSSSKSKCGQDLIKGHADLHGEFAAAIQKKEGNPVFIPRDVPDSCV